MRQRNPIAVALSGGVDSAVAAALLLEKKCEIFGVTMLLQGPDSAGSEAARMSDVERVSRQVAARLGIDHYVVDLRREFAAEVIGSFVQSYQRGETPNPCIRCNAGIKFGRLLEAAKKLGADTFATGHYAQATKVDAVTFKVDAVIDTAASDGNALRYTLRRGVDTGKDQSYMLYALSQEQLRRIWFPLGGLTKAQVRAEACRLGVSDVVEQKESQDVCFIDGEYAEFVARYGGAGKPGSFVDKQGRVLGSHPGIAHFTVGQRKGLGIALGHRAYVIGIDPVRHEVILGDEKDAWVKELWADRVNWNLGENFSDFPQGMRLQAQIRYHAQAADACVYHESDKVRVVFDTAQKAVAPGQAVVFYCGDVLAGGGRIVSDFRGIRQDLLEKV
ncbi:MAG: tRNA 2-thiouridine(34) synthase MnmA [Peptococcaceae bacterium]|nr:tRNA 2-thiouridine(34) synthase MnmA [Peptococcaceae bacterium]